MTTLKTKLAALITSLSLALTILLLLPLLVSGREASRSPFYPLAAPPLVIKGQHLAPQAQLTAATISSPAASAVISGPYRGTIAVTLGLLDMAFDITQAGSVITGAVDTARTLVFDTTPAPALHGVITHGNDITPTFYLASNVFDGIVSGRQVQRSFSLVGQSLEDGEILQGLYTEIITGFTPRPLVMEGIFMVTRPPLPQDFSALSALELKTAHKAVWVNGSTTVSVTLLNGYREAFTETTHITLTSSLGSLSPVSVDTSGSGLVIVTFNAGAAPGQATILATTGELTGTTSVEIMGYSPAALTLAADAVLLPTSGGSGSAGTTVVTVTVRDQVNQAVSGAVAAFAATLGTMSPVTAATNAEGIATSTFTAGAMPGQASITAECEGLGQSVALQLATPQVTALDLQVGAAAIQPGAQTSLVVTVHDQFGRPMAGELVSLFGSLGTVSPSSGLSDGNGQVAATFTAGSVPGQAALTALAGYASDSTTIRVQFLTPPALRISSDSLAQAGKPVSVVVSFAGNSYEIATTAFSIDFDQACLAFDPADRNLDGIPDAVQLNLPGAFGASVTFDGSDVDGEMDWVIGDSAPPLSPLPVGILATITFTAMCQPVAGSSITAPVGFSGDPAASFGDTGGQSVAGATSDGWVEILFNTIPGDCNGDQVVDAGDISALVLEIFDGDGASPAATPGGTFPGTPGSDANQDGLVDAGDVSCLVLIIFNGPGACGGGRAPAAAQEFAPLDIVADSNTPVLALPVAVLTSPGSTVTLPITFSSNGHAISSMVFSVDYDQDYLGFDTTDYDGNGIPDAITLNLPAGFDASVSLDPGDAGGELDLFIADVAPPLTALPDGILVAITFSVTHQPGPGARAIATVSFSGSPSASFGNDRGQSVAGSASGGSIQIQGEPTAITLYDLRATEGIRLGILAGTGILCVAAWWVRRRRTFKG